MDITIFPGKLRGTVEANPSKSHAHRLMICAAFARGETMLLCRRSNRDMDATADCLRALGAEITATEAGFRIRPAQHIPDSAELPCGESGSTLRFLLPVAGALGVTTRFRMEGRLPQRPLSPLSEEMERMGCRLTRPSPDTILCEGKLCPGVYSLDGGISSQFITGLLLASSLMYGQSRIDIQGKFQSKPYVDMTRAALALFGVSSDDLTVTGGDVLRSPGTVPVEGDWSSAAFFLAAAALGSEITVTGLNPVSAQGDRRAEALLPALAKKTQTISLADVPDLAPALAVTAACRHGAVFTDAGRLRLKESDRMETVCALIRSLGGSAEIQGDSMVIHGTGLIGGTVDAAGDHRIAMAAAIAATDCRERVTILGAQCAEKSYPEFFREYRRLGGRYEQYLR